LTSPEDAFAGYREFDTSTGSDVSISDTDILSENDEDEDEKEEIESTFQPEETDGNVKTLKDTEGTSQQLLREQQWQEIAISDPQIAPFTAHSGVSIGIPCTATPIEILKEFLTDELIEMIVTRTNRYAELYIRRETVSSKSRVVGWKPITEEDMWNFLALTLLMGVSKKPSIPDYWSTNPLFYNSTYRTTMPRNQYQLIHKFLHFEDIPDGAEGGEDEDRISKIRPVIEYLIKRFQQIYTLEREVCIDEQRLLKTHDIPIYRNQSSIKMFSLRDGSGYLWNTEIYAGKNDILSLDEVPADLEASVGKPGAIVVRLMQPLLGKGYQIFTDSYFTSSNLYQYLHNRQTAACGELKKHKEANFPSSFLSGKLNRGETRYGMHGNVVASRFMDGNKEAYVMTTMHRPDQLTTEAKKRDKDGKKIMKNKVLAGYNSLTRAVVKNNDTMNTHSSVRASHKWTTKMVLQYIEEAIMNAYIVHTKLNKDNSNHTMRFADFKVMLVTNMITHTDDRPDLHQQDRSLPRNQGRHYMEHIPVTGKKTRPTRKCVHCSSKSQARKETRYQCADCHRHPALCLIPCFKEYHS